MKHLIPEINLLSLTYRKRTRGEHVRVESYASSSVPILSSVTVRARIEFRKLPKSDDATGTNATLVRSSSRDRSRHRGAYRDRVEPLLSVEANPLHFVIRRGENGTENVSANEGFLL